MKIKLWYEGLSDVEAREVAYWERNVLALRYAEGWFKDPISQYPGFHRVLSLENGKITFHIPDDFDVGNLPEMSPNWDGHSTESKWRLILKERKIEPD